MDNLTLWEPARSLRLKTTDRCSWNCWWCHNEGSGPRDPRHIGDIAWDVETHSAIQAITSELRYKEVHLTGGEPFMHPHLPQLIKGLRGLGLNVKATSIGCKITSLRTAVAEGLNGINFSLHALDPMVLQATQINRTAGWAQQQLTQQIHAIMEAKRLGVEVKLNTVLASSKDARRVKQVLNWAQDLQVPLRILNELSSGGRANDAIVEFLIEIGASRFHSKYVRGSSSFSVIYRLPNGFEVAVKQIRDNYLDHSMCSGCRLRLTGQCAERFYGVRLEKRRISGKWQLCVRLCIHRTDEDTFMPVERFLRSDQLMEIRRNSELAQEVAGDGMSSASGRQNGVKDYGAHLLPQLGA